jgi:hypothetical protein
MIRNHLPEWGVTVKPCIQIFAVLCMLLSAFIFLSCEAQENENTTKYKVVDTGMWVMDDGGLPEPWWLDNERVMFPTNEKMQPDSGPKTMMIWNVSTEQVVPSQISSVICVREGQVFYENKDQSIYYRGLLDNPKEHDAPGPDMRIDQRYDCDWVPKSSRANIPYKLKLKGENYLEVIEGKPDQSGTPRENLNNKRSSSRPSHGKGGPQLNTVVYYEHPGSKAIELPFKLGGYNGYDIKYIEWRKAYLVKPDQYYIDKPIRLWWLEPNGKVYEEPLPDKFPFPAGGWH